MTLQKGYINGVDLARIIGAIGIVVFHFTCHCDFLRPYLFETANFPYGQLWVALFFAMSGACVARSNTDTSIWKFYKKRWLSIFPLFFLAYIAVFAVHLLIYGVWWKNISLWTIPLSLIGMDSYFYYIQPTFSVIGEWFIGALICCYLLYPLLRWLLKTIPFTTEILLIIGCCFIPYLGWFNVEPWHNIWVCATIFYSGMLLAQFPQVFTSKYAFIIAIVVTALLLCVPLPLKHIACFRDIIYPALGGIAVFITIVHVGRFVENMVTNNRILPHLGKISYPIFLLQHTIIMDLLSKITPFSPVRAIGILMLDVLLTLLFSDMLLAAYETIVSKIKKN